MLVDIHRSDAQGNVFTLKETLMVRYAGLVVLVPVGFESDGASVPRFFWRVVFPPGDDKALRAAFVHDYLYRVHPPGWTRELADLMFHDLLIEDGVPNIRAALAWTGVRIGGRKAWEAGEK